MGDPFPRWLIPVATKDARRGLHPFPQSLPPWTFPKGCLCILYHNGWIWPKQVVRRLRQELWCLLYLASDSHTSQEVSIGKPWFDVGGKYTERRRGAEDCWGPSSRPATIGTNIYGECLEPTGSNGPEMRLLAELIKAWVIRWKFYNHKTSYSPVWCRDRQLDL